MKKNLKKIAIFFGILGIIIIEGILILKKDDKFTVKVVNYQGNDLRISINGSSATSLPTTGTYYLINYDCNNANTVLTWNHSTHELKVSNGTGGGKVKCDLTFESNPFLTSMKVGSYVAYTGIGGTVGSTSVACQTNGSASSSSGMAETEAPNSCSGQNAREDLDTSDYNYGYCYKNAYYYRYYTTGWRIAYINNNKAIIVSAGAPECVSRTESTANETYIKSANARALKYCNTNYVDGNCTCTDSNGDGACDSPSTDAWAINDTDFYYITKAISGTGKRLTEGSSSLGDNGGTLGSTLYCNEKSSYQECGYNNDLLDNGGYYFFAAKDSSSSSNAVYWRPYRRIVSIGEDDETSAKTGAQGFRPVIRLSSTVYVTGGSGTMDDPYTIGTS